MDEPAAQHAGSRCTACSYFMGRADRLRRLDSGVNSTLIVSTITLTCSVAVFGESSPGKPRWADGRRAVGPFRSGLCT